MKTFSLSAGGCRPVWLLAAVCGIIFCACHKEHDTVEPPVVPEVKASYAVHGVVTDLNNRPVEGVLIRISGETPEDVTSGSDGSFLVSSLESAGDYVVEASKSGFMPVSKKITVEHSLIDVTIRLPFEPVAETVKATEENQLVLPAAGNTLSTDVQLQIPAGALSEDREVRVTEIADDTPGDASLIVLNYQPDGTSFQTPCSLVIPSPIDDYELEGVKLQWYDPDSETWQDQPQNVVFENKAYVTSITHFSSYKVTGFARGESALSEEKCFDKRFDNFDGRGDMPVNELPYSFKQGTKYIVTPEAAAAAAGIDNPKVIDFVRSTVYAGSDFTEVPVTYPLHVTLPAGVRMDVDGVQAFTTTDYTFNFKQGGRRIALRVQTKTAGTVSVATSLYTKEHDGGSTGL